MKVCAIIAEYNPFHNGHKLHLETAKSLTGATHTLAVMSGGYVQRGEMALFDKWMRAKMAVANGVDLVLELPACFSVSSAEYYAKYNVNIINRLNVADFLAFGCECDRLDDIKKVADLVSENDGDFAKALKKHIDNGESFPKARSMAICEVLGDEFADITDKPNNILAIEYLKALKRENSNIVPVGIKRTGAGHDSDDICGNIASASYIRQLFREGNYAEVYKYVPKASDRIIRRAVADGEYASFMKYHQMILNNLITKDAVQLENVRDVREGIENRICEAVRNTQSYEELVESIKTRRYTRTTIERILLNSVMGITKEFDGIVPPYVKVLAFNDKGRQILAKMRDVADIKVVTKPTDAADADTVMAKQVFAKEIMAQEIYSKCMKMPAKSARELRTSPYYVK